MRLVAHKPDNECTVAGPHRADECCKQPESHEEGGHWGDPGRCPTCGAAFEWVRPGKSQATCDCWSICAVHGHGAVQYHPRGEYANITGYFCARCFPEVSAFGQAGSPVAAAQADALSRPSGLRSSVSQSEEPVAESASPAAPPADALGGVRLLLARVAELEAWKREAAATLFQAGGNYATARQQLVAAQERIKNLEGAIRLIRDQVRPVMVGDAYLSATAEVPVAAVEAAAGLLAAP